MVRLLGVIGRWRGNNSVLRKEYRLPSLSGNWLINTAAWFFFGFLPVD
jgi:hypothetical protein